MAQLRTQPSSIGNGSGKRKAESPKAVPPTTAGPGYHLAPGYIAESRRRQKHYQPVVTMSSEAETQQQAPQPAADAESPSSPAAAASAGDKKVIGKTTGN